MSKHEYAGELPFWYDGKSVNEVGFCEEFLQQHPMVCVGGSFFTKDGRITDEESVRKKIYEMLRPFLTCGLAKRASGLLEMVKLEAYVPNLPVHEDRIHVRTAHCFSAASFAQKRNSAATVCRSNMMPMLRSQSHGCIFYRNFWRTRTFLLCKSTSAIAFFPLTVGKP